MSIPSPTSRYTKSCTSWPNGRASRPSLREGVRSDRSEEIAWQHPLESAAQHDGWLRQCRDTEGELTSRGRAEYSRRGGGRDATPLASFRVGSLGSVRRSCIGGRTGLRPQRRILRHAVPARAPP